MQILRSNSKPAVSESAFQQDLQVMCMHIKVLRAWSTSKIHTSLKCGVYSSFRLWQLNCLWLYSEYVIERTAQLLWLHLVQICFVSMAFQIDKLIIRGILLVYQKSSGTLWTDSHQLSQSSSDLCWHPDVWWSITSCPSHFPFPWQKKKKKSELLKIFLKIDLRIRFPFSQLAPSHSINLFLLQTLIFWLGLLKHRHTVFEPVTSKVSG